MICYKIFIIYFIDVPKFYYTKHEIINFLTCGSISYIYIFDYFIPSFYKWNNKINYTKKYCI